MESICQVSIIIAVYNAASYLHGGIEKILEQGFKDIEILLVDDGSTDNTGEICDEYAEKDSRIRAFHEQHRGVAHARQVGIDNASGEYVLYIDADDDIAPTFIEEMYCKIKAEDADMVICDYMELMQDGSHHRIQQPSDLNGVAYLNDILCGRCYGALWNKMFRRELVDKANAKFPENLSMREDVVFISQILPFVRKVAYIPKALYGYNRLNTSSLTNNYLDESIDYYRQESTWNKFILTNRYLYDETRHRISCYLVNLAYITLRNDMFPKNEWYAYYGDCKSLVKTFGQGYKAKIVGIALAGHFTVARTLRDIISFISHRTHR